MIRPYKNMVTKVYEVYTDLEKEPEGTFNNIREAINFGATLKDEYYIQEKLYTIHRVKEENNYEKNNASK